MGWGPWVEHDGAGVSVPEGATLEIRFGGEGIRPGERAAINVDAWPGFFWRWKRVRTGWFSSEMRRVCDDPAYAPIIAYRLHRPDGMAVLQRIVAAPREIAVAPERVDT